MALEGTLRDFSLADIFQLISLQRKTGVLTLRSTEDVVTISFLDGRIVGSDSLNKRLEDRLGQVLLKTRTLTRAELEVALKTQMETLERLGHILLRPAVISRDQLRRALEQQILQIIFRVFRWQDGDYQFSQETSVDYDAELVVPMAAESILMEGARMLDEWPIIEKRIPHRGIIFLQTSAAALAEVAPDAEMEELDPFDGDPGAAARVNPSGRLRISQLESDVLHLLDGASPVDEVIRNSAYGEFETCKALYGLLTRSLIREATREELRRADPRVAARAASAIRPLPWLVFPALALALVSFVAIPRNPLNPILGPRPRLSDRLTSASSWMRMWSVWQILNGHATTAGTYPEALTDLVHERLLPLQALRDPWQHQYRYLLRDQSVLLTGDSPAGVPDPELMLSQHLPPPDSLQSTGPGATLLIP